MLPLKLVIQDFFRITIMPVGLMSALLCSTALSFSQTISARDGNIYFVARDGRTSQLTSSGLDSQPSLSVDGQLAVFVRRTPQLQISTGAGTTDANELWVAPTSGTQVPRLVLVGHSGGFDVGADLVLAGFYSPQFSPDSKRIYFGAEVGAAFGSIRVLDVASGQVRYLCAGLSVEVVKSGRRAGYVIVLKAIPRAMPPASVARYWLLKPDGSDVGEIGEKASDVEEFKRDWNGN